MRRLGSLSAVCPRIAALVIFVRFPSVQAVVGRGGSYSVDYFLTASAAQRICTSALGPAVTSAPRSGAPVPPGATGASARWRPARLHPLLRLLRRRSPAPYGAPWGAVPLPVGRPWAPRGGAVALPVGAHRAHRGAHPGAPWGRRGRPWGRAPRETKASETLGCEVAALASGKIRVVLGAKSAAYPAATWGRAPAAILPDETSRPGPLRGAHLEWAWPILPKKRR